MRTVFAGSILALVALTTGCRTTARRSVDQTIDRFHAAAARADEDAYFACFAPEAIFLGTDATERWNLEQFRQFAHPYFAQGKGWTYKSTRRRVTLSPSGDIAWFDELLQNDKLGTCRGSGVLRYINGHWKIAQYNLSIPIPNDLATPVVAMIRSPATTQTTQATQTSR